MQRILRLIGIVLILALFAPTASAQQATRSYLLLGKSDKLPANLEQSVAEKGGAVAYTVPEIGMAVLTSANPNFQAQMESVAEVESVAPDIQVSYEMPDFQPQAMPHWSGSPFDFAQYQWNLDAIDAPEAWATSERGAGVRIAIVDDGLFAAHPDLSPNLNVELSKSFIPDGVGPFTPANFPSHASLVAGIAAAVDDGFGIIGVAPQAEIVGVRVSTWTPDASSPIGYAPSGTFADLAAGIVYAAKIDSDVINISLGGWVNKNGNCTNNSSDNCLTAKDVKKILKLLDRATRYAHKKGALVIAAAGNDWTDADTNGERYFLPAQSDNVIAVSATGPVNWITFPETDLDVFAPYSNYGNSIVDFAAPGGNPTLAFDPSPCWALFPVFDIFDESGNLIQPGILPCFYFDNVWGPSSSAAFPWTLASGTSAAAPHVSGVAALIIGKNGGSMSPDLVEQLLQEGADDLGVEGKDPFFGNGRVNAAASLLAMDVTNSEKDKKDKREVGDRSVTSSCASAVWACPASGQNLLFLGLISNQ